MKKIILIVLLLFTLSCQAHSSSKQINKLELNITPQEIKESKEQIFAQPGTYLPQFEKQVVKYWNPPKLHKNYNVLTYIVLNKEGQVVKRSIVKSSGVKQLDNSALKAIDDGAPYQKFPKEYDDDIINIQFTFNYMNYN